MYEQKDWGLIMITVDSEGTHQLLTIMENVVQKGIPPNREEIDKLLKTNTFQFLLEAYSRWPVFSKETYTYILENLSKKETVENGTIASLIEKGLRNCLHKDKIRYMMRELSKIVEVDFSKAEKTALRYLPPNTSLQSTIHITVDPLNPGMVYNGNIGLSILSFNAENFDHQYLAHELHHIGSTYWINQNPQLRNLELKEAETLKQIGANLLVNLLSEGIANYYITPNMVKTSPKANDKHNEKIRRYESTFPQMWDQTYALITDCAYGSDTLESCRERLMKLLLDPECVLPPIHFIGARIIRFFNEDKSIEQKEIIELCKDPYRFFTLYERISKNRDLSRFSEDIEELLKQAR
jgi:hypothetical protein